ncbi:polysaccharide pyruvyl transferase family protein [Selenomonas sp. ND2010]|uniref:polysaccharide pyruvyl transferase family protein n=1 Tax=Selenomonas sp. ND2010 TaxID=1410618 RepID=UPI00051B49A4|nr:polysaccharide pyruvyl transferase family protein [Selenomonas sp. ND2010]
MKIGILTLWKTEFNYGATLQCYALQEYLRKKGHEPYLIRYSNKKTKRSLKRFSVGKAINLIRAYYAAFKKRKIVDLPRNFEQFRCKYIDMSEDEYVGYESLKTKPPEADMYIVGSDQVWNFYKTPIECSKDPIHAYFLDFGNKEIKRVSYAASWDKKYLLECHIAEIKPLLKKFDYVSVREKSGIEACEICGCKNAEWVVDPTLLLSADEYRKIYNENPIRNVSEKYVLLYMVLTQKKVFDIDYIYEFAKKRNLKVIYVAEDKTDDKYKKYYPTIPEWLYLIDNAEYVVTNSFHGTVFSLIFNKKYVTIPLEGYSKATNKRIESLCEIFKTKPRFVNDKKLEILDLSYEAEYEYSGSGFDKFVDSCVK